MAEMSHDELAEKISSQIKELRDEQNRRLRHVDNTLTDISKSQGKLEAAADYLHERLVAHDTMIAKQDVRLDDLAEREAKKEGRSYQTLKIGTIIISVIAIIVSLWVGLHPPIG